MAKSHSKYNSKKVIVDGITFDSKHEAQRWTELKLMERAKKISGLQRQVKFVLIPAQRGPSPGVFAKGSHKGEPKPGRLLEHECSYLADFVYIQNGETVVEDAKGMRTTDYIIKRKLMLYRHGIIIREV